MNENGTNLSKDFIDSIKPLVNMVTASQDSAAAMLYRLMFRHEKNISILDKHADQILDGLLGIGSKYVEEDYRNFLQYLKVVLPNEYEAHKRLFDDSLAENEDDFEIEE